ncbi:hypothetical protein AB685_21870 [Bacillus sp. LL01]|uniref:helix-turn-helix transcriptional regulator n=1 Tax=Bacillus sp. LL01 TaxID=1665556 RepID=UPI00064D3B94|nr:helix-turn-helix transcriptional regulator [Bacillus sp. LL01]KMJ56438.1 hypothetical protein AB685_21870 [Bacillus sp. LL01]
MISDIVKKHRLERGMPISELARRTGLSRVTITDIENGNTDPKFSTVMKIYEVLNIDSQQIFFGRSVNLDLQRGKFT